LLPVIHGQSSLISQFLHPTCFEITGIITKPIKLNEIANIKISIVYCVISRYIAIINGMNQFGTTIQIFLLNTLLNDFSVPLLNNLGDTAPYLHGQAKVS